MKQKQHLRLFYDCRNVKRLANGWPSHGRTEPVLTYFSSSKSDSNLPERVCLCLLT